MALLFQIVEQWYEHHHLARVSDQIFDTGSVEINATQHSDTFKPSNSSKHLGQSQFK
jgi:hypothetical protein